MGEEGPAEPVEHYRETVKERLQLRQSQLKEGHDNFSAYRMGNLIAVKWRQGLGGMVTVVLAEPTLSKRS